MKKFAILSGNIVDNVVVAESNDIAQSIFPGCIEVEDSDFCGVGSIYDSTTGKFTNPDLNEVAE